MKKFTNYFTDCFKKKEKPIKFKKETNEDIIKKEIDAFIDLEMYDISNSFIEKHGMNNIINKLKQQYFWTIDDKIEDQDLYISLDEWHLKIY